MKYQFSQNDFCFIYWMETSNREGQLSLWSGLSLETHVEWDILSRTISEIYTRCDWFVAACGLELSWDTSHALLAGRKKEASFLFSLSPLCFWPSIPFFHSLFFSLSLSPRFCWRLLISVSSSADWFLLSLADCFSLFAYRVDSLNAHLCHKVLFSCFKCEYS